MVYAVLSKENMKKNSFFWWFLLFLAIGSLVFFGIRITSSEKPTSSLSIGTHTWEVEYVTTEAERERGLGFRESLPSQKGMLFLFPTPDRYAFWMHGMRFPLDIVFLASNRVVSIERHIQASDTRIFTPPVPVEAVLEINAGEGDGVEPGVEVRGLSQNFSP